MTDNWEDVTATVRSYTDRRLARIHNDYDDVDRRPPVTYGPRHHDPESPPLDSDALIDLIGGIASIYLFYTPEHRETVLVYNPAGGWEPPGGVVEGGRSHTETARAEAREETGLEIAVTDAVYTRRFEFRFADGRAVDLPIAQFVGHRTAGTLSVEREGQTHPGTTRATGLFDRDTLPEMRRDRERLVRLLADPPAWDGESE
jgi:ADP-ribose pyrophosphatase YjhB (NUDIX family)